MYINYDIHYFKSYSGTFRGYPDNWPPRKIAPRLGLGFRLSGGHQTIAPEENSSPVRIRVWLWVSFGVSFGQFSSEAIVVEPYSE